MQIKSQNEVRIFEDEDIVVVDKISRLLTKKMIAVFLKSSGIIQHVVFDKQKKVIIKWNNKQCLSITVNLLKNPR